LNGAQKLKNKKQKGKYGTPYPSSPMVSGFGKGYGMRTDPKNESIISQAGTTNIGLGVGCAKSKGRQHILRTNTQRMGIPK